MQYVMKDMICHKFMEQISIMCVVIEKMFDDLNIYRDKLCEIQFQNLWQCYLIRLKFSSFRFRKRSIIQLFFFCYIIFGDFMKKRKYVLCVFATHFKSNFRKIFEELV